MTPRSRFVADLVFPPPVGRVCRSTGAKTAEDHTLRVAFLRALYEDHGRPDLLIAIRKGPRRGGLSVAQVWSYRKRLHDLPAADVLVPLLPAWEAWVATARASTAHASRRQMTRDRLAEVVTPTLGLREARVHDLPALLTALRAQREAADAARAWSYDKSNASAFVRDRYGKAHPLYARVRALLPLVKRAKRVKGPLTVAEWDRLVPALLAQPMRGRWTTTDDPNAVSPESAARAQEAVALCWTMLVTGMGPAELYEVEDPRTRRRNRWQVEPAFVHIEGTKRDSRVRDVPRWRLPAEYVKPAKVTRDALEQRFERATADTIGRRTLYDLRRTFSVWCEEAGIPHSRIVRYMGHAAPDMTTLYQSHQRRDELRTDGDKLVHWLQAQRRPRSLTLVSEGHVP